MPVGKLPRVTETAVVKVTDFVSRRGFKCIVSGPTVGGEYMVLRGRFMLFYLILPFYCFLFFRFSFLFLCLASGRRAKISSRRRPEKSSEALSHSRVLEDQTKRERKGADTFNSLKIALTQLSR